MIEQLHIDYVLLKSMSAVTVIAQKFYFILLLFFFSFCYIYLVFVFDPLGSHCKGHNGAKCRTKP